MTVINVCGAADRYAARVDAVLAQRTRLRGPQRPGDLDAGPPRLSFKSLPPGFNSLFDRFNSLFDGFNSLFDRLGNVSAAGLVKQWVGEADRGRKTGARPILPVISCRLGKRPRGDPMRAGYFGQKKMLTFLANNTFWSRVILRPAIFQTPATRRSTSRRAPT